MKQFTATVLLSAFVVCLIGALVTIMSGPVSVATAETALFWLVGAAVSGITALGVAR